MYPRNRVSRVPYYKPSGFNPTQIASSALGRAGEELDKDFLARLIENRFHAIESSER